VLVYDLTERITMNVFIRRRISVGLTPAVDQAGLLSHTGVGNCDSHAEISVHGDRMSGVRTAVPGSVKQA
jgi:hypothetical protein